MKLVLFHLNLLVKLSCTPASRSFSDEVSALSFKSHTKASNKPFPRATRFLPGTFARKHLHNPSQSLVFEFICKSVVSFEPVAVNENFAPMSVCQRVNVVRSVFCHPHVSFLPNLLFTTVNLVRPVTVYIMLSLSIQHIIFAECFHSRIVLQESIGTFLAGGMGMLQAFLCHHRIYFLLLILNLIFHL